MQIANRDTIPYASRPYIRILGLATAAHASVGPAGPPLPTDAPVRLVDRSTKDRVAWTSVSASLEHQSPEPWTSWRRAVSHEVLEAAQSRTMRSVAKARASGLLSMWPLAMDAPEGPCAGPAPRIVSEVSRDGELRGQTWAAIAIIGDPEAAQARDEILETLGRQYFEALKSFTGQETDETAEEHFFLWTPDKRDTFMETLQGPTRDAHLALRTIIVRPCVAVFDVSEDPDDLARRIADLASVPELLHADIAVVRLYSWLAVDRTYGSKHVARNPAAQELFDAMRRAEEKH